MKKRNFLMIYDNSWNVPNGDPFTGQQRFDNANQKIMVSDLRIKRFIRDKYIDLSSEPIYYKWDSIDAEKLLKNISGSALVFRKKLLEKGLISNIEIPDLKEFKKNNKDVSFLDIMKEFADVRLFGGLLTEKDNNINVDGAIQFKIMNYSLNEVKQEVFQNTTVFPSSTANEIGSIGTSSLIPYSVVAVEGCLDELTAEINKLTENDIDEMLACMWIGIRDKNTRSKYGQSPILLLEVIYKGEKYKFNPAKTIYKKIQSISSLVKIRLNNTTDDVLNIRSNEDYTLDLTKLLFECDKDNVESVNFYTEDEKLKEFLKSNKKFKFKNIL